MVNAKMTEKNFIAGFCEVSSVVFSYLSELKFSLKPQTFIVIIMLFKPQLGNKCVLHLHIKIAKHINAKFTRLENETTELPVSQCDGALQCIASFVSYQDG